MDISTAGPWALLGTGIVLTLMGGWRAAKEHAPITSMPWPLIIGFVFAGTGVFGPSFVNDYGHWIREATAFRDATTAEAAKARFANLTTGILDGSMPLAVQELVIPMLADYVRSDDLPPAFDTQAALDSINMTLQSGQNRPGSDSLAILRDTIIVREGRDVQLSELSRLIETAPPDWQTNPEVQINIGPAWNQIVQLDQHENLLRNYQGGPTLQEYRPPAWLDNVIISPGN